MNKIIVSINPIYVKNILNETKKYEYRRVAAKQDVKSILIYETAPIKMVVAEVEILEVLECSPEELNKRFIWNIKTIFRCLFCW